MFMNKISLGSYIANSIKTIQYAFTLLKYFRDVCDKYLYFILLTSMQQSTN